MGIAQTKLWSVVLGIVVFINGAFLMLPDGSLLKKLDQLSAAGNNQRDIEAYSEEIGKLGSLDKLHEPFAAAFTKRLAADELRVRTGKQARVSELAVSMAFNRIAEEVGAAPRANVDTVHAFRKTLEPYASRLITSATFPDSCNPGEALFLIYIMIANDATLKQVSPDAGQQLQANSLRVTVKPERQPPAMKVMVAKFVAEKQDVEILRRLEGVLSLLRL
jgi:hypothetical protein